MLEVLEGIIKGFATLIRLFIEAGLPDVSLRGSGRFVIRALYPPHWARPTIYPRRIEIFFGVCSWALCSYFVWSLSQATFC